MILPGATIGIIGGGQLGRMMAISAKQMGYKIAVLEPSKNGPLAQIADYEINAPYDCDFIISDLSEEALIELLNLSDVVMYEFENIDGSQIKRVEARGYLPQGERPLMLTQQRYIEKKAINKCGFQTAPYEKVEGVDELKQAVLNIGYPCILKTVRL